MVDVVLCLGSNLGNREEYLQRMEGALALLLMPPIRKSRVMETEPLGSTSSHPWYLNRLVRGSYGETPGELLAACQRIERELGRTRPGKYAPRTADIDIILFGDIAVNEKDLVIPHRHILDRRFCLEGLNEIAGERIVPGTAGPVSVLVREMPAAVQRQQVRYQPKKNARIRYG